MNNKRIIVSIILSLVLLIGGTYAYIYFYTEKTAVTMMVDGDRISFNAGENIIASSIVPVYRMEEGIVKEIEIYKENGKYQAGIDLYLELTSWPTSFSSNSLRWALYKNNNFLYSGNFLGTKQGNNIKLTSYSQKINLEENKDIYKLYIWIDAVTESSIDMMNKSFTVNLYGKVNFYLGDETTVKEVEPNAPELADGMIPIRYNYIIDEWQKADSTNIDNNWYDYSNKMWANAVLVNTESREGYMNAEVGTTVNEEDILAYYVWIPRYKYILFNVNSESIDPLEIQIEFEKTTDPVSQGTQNGEFLSHPAFWWDNDSDAERATDGSEELAGIWVGKFETGGNEAQPSVKPNIISLTALTLYKLFNLNKLIQNSAYLTEEGVNEIDAHMMKNTDWGSVAYLSHSRYGINKKISRNDVSNYISGRQGNYTYNDFLVVDGNITLSKVPGTGILTSTTGNVYGIYDMVGGSAEYVMGVIKSSSTSNIPEWYGAYTDFNTSNAPLSKYYNLYEYGNSTTDYGRRILGDATGETNGWYNVEKSFINSGNVFFLRGGKNNNQNSGIFNFSVNMRSRAENFIGSRSVIVLP